MIIIHLQVLERAWNTMGILIIIISRLQRLIVFSLLKIVMEILGLKKDVSLINTISLELEKELFMDIINKLENMMVQMEECLVMEL